MAHGYYYALGLLFSSLISSLLNAQFNYQVGIHIQIDFIREKQTNALL